MGQNSYQVPSHRLAIGLSIGLHLLLLLVGYCIAVSQGATSMNTGYSITLTSVANQQQAAVTTSKPSTTPQKPVKKPSTPTKPSPAKPSQETKPTSTENPSSPVKEQEAAKTVDERGLYQAQPGQQAGAKLDLAGWMWDTTPQPQDDTEESGKIIFEIKIDEFGEVIAVRTLEKTVSPLVEKLYKDALTDLTFSRTADNIAYASVYTGKVTFILRTK